MTTGRRVLALTGRPTAARRAPGEQRCLDGATSTALRLGYDVLVLDGTDGGGGGGGGGVAGVLRRRLDAGDVDGVVLLDVVDADPRLPVLRAASQPGVVVGAPVGAEGLDAVELDLEETGRLLVAHLADLGHRDVVLVGRGDPSPFRRAPRARRLQDAAREEARRRGVRLGVHPLVGDPADADGELARALGARPGATAVVVDDEDAAVALAGVLARRGTSVPEDVSVLVRCALEVVEGFPTPWTAVGTSAGRLGELAVRQLVRRLEGTGRTEPRATRLLTPALVDRGSTAPPRGVR